MACPKCGWDGLEYKPESRSLWAITTPFGWVEAIFCLKCGYKLEPPKRKVKKVLHGWVNIYPNNQLVGVYESRKMADKRAGMDRIFCKEISEEYEVEDE